MGVVLAAEQQLLSLIVPELQDRRGLNTTVLHCQSDLVGFLTATAGLVYPLSGVRPRQAMLDGQLCWVVLASDGPRHDGAQTLAWFVG